MGRFPLDHLPRRRRGGDRLPQRAADDPVLSGGGRGGQAEPARALRGRRRDRRGGRRPAGVRGAAAAHPSGRQPGQAAVRADPGQLHRLRPARPRRHRLHRPALRGPPGRPGGGAGRRRAADPPDPDHPRPRPGHRVVLPVRGGRAGRGRGQAAGRQLPARQADDVQDQAPAHRRLRGRRLPGAQERPGQHRLAAARPLQRRRRPGLGRRDRRLPGGPAQGAVRRAAAAGHHLRRPSVGLGQAGGGRPHPAELRVQPLERRQGPLLRAAAARAGGRGPLRAHGGRPVPAHRPVQPLAARPRSALVHLRAARGTGQVRPGRHPPGALAGLGGSRA